MTDSRPSLEFFSASYAKVRRARVHINELSDALKAFASTNPVKITSEVADVNGVKQWVTHAKFEGVPISVGPIIGDVFHNLRTALDLLISDLAVRAKVSVKGLQFPIGKSQEDFRFQIDKYKLRKLGSSVVSLLEEVAPYPGGDDMLVAIRQLNNQDKHRSILPTAMSFAGPVFDTHTQSIVGDPNAVTDMKFQFPAEGPLANHEVLSTLLALADRIEVVIAMFAENATA
jgi:hypothetical protein